MTNKTKKHIGPVAMMSLVVAGLLAVVVALSASPQQVAQAHDCETLTGSDRARCESLHTRDGVDHAEDDGTAPVNGGNGNGGVDDSHVGAPRYFELEALDNGVRLNWLSPSADTVADGARLIRYEIDRDAYDEDQANPINMYGDTTIKVNADTRLVRDLGLGYETTYTYKVRALVRYSSTSAGYSDAVADWWNSLDCVMMNDVVANYVGDGPATGPDEDMTRPYCFMYAGLLDDAKAVVKRTYDAVGYNAGAWSRAQSITTAESGGRLEALLDPPTAPQALGLGTACANSITLSWSAPADPGTAPAIGDGGVYVGPDYIGGRRVGKEEVGETATISGYQVYMKSYMTVNADGSMNDGADFEWVTVEDFTTQLSYVDNDVAYGYTYEYAVRARNSANLWSPWATDHEVLEVPPGVNAPSNVRATLNEDGEVVLQWTAPQGGNQEWFDDDDADPTVNNSDLSGSLTYRIERVDAANADTGFGMPTQPHQYGPRSFDTPRITHEQTRTDPNPYDGEATYVVTALVHDCLPSEGNSVTLDTQISMPGTPGNVSATASGGMITVTWTAPSDAGSVGDRQASITGYDVERSTTSGSGFMSVASGHSGTSYTDMGLDYDTTYYYRVIAVNSFGAKSAMSAETNATTAVEMLGTASNITIGINNGGTIQVSWDAASNAAGYIVIAIHKDDNSATSGSVNVLSDGTVPTTLNLSGLTVGDDYYVYVATTGSAGDNTLSEPVEATAN